MKIVSNPKAALSGRVKSCALGVEGKVMQSPPVTPWKSYCVYCVSLELQPPCGCQKLKSASHACAGSGVSPLVAGLAITLTDDEWKLTPRM